MEEQRSPITKGINGVGGGPTLGNNTHEFERTTTTDSYEDIGEPFEKVGLLTTRIHISNLGGGGNVADIRVLGSLDGGKSYPVVASAEQAVNDGDSVNVSVTDYYTHLKLQAKANTPGSQTDVEGQAAAIAG